MLRRALLGLAGCGLIASSALAQDADPYDAKVAALAHPRYAEREKAARDLEAAGEPALKALKAAATSTDPEVRDRAAAITERINRVILSKRLLVSPKISLTLDKVPLQQALAQVAQKTGLRFHIESGKVSNLQRAITLKTGEMPFWEAIDAFYTAAGLVENDMPPAPVMPSAEAPQQRIRAIKRLGGGPIVDGSMIRLTDGKITLPVDNSKAMRVRVLPAEYPQNKYDPATGDITFHLDVDVATGADVRELIGVEVRNAVADDRRTLPNAYPPASFAPGMFQEEMLMIQQAIVISDLQTDGGFGTPRLHTVTLKSGGTRTRQLAQLEGVVVARMLAPPEVLITIADVFDKSKSHTQSADGVTLSVKSHDSPGLGTQSIVRVRLVSAGESLNDVINLPVQVKGRVRPFLRINRGGGNMPANAPELKLHTSDGKQVKVLSMRMVESIFDGTNSSQEIEVRIETPSGGLDGVSLTLTGRRSAVVEMPFLLKNVPLP